MDLPKTMSGVVLTGVGGPEMLAWRDDLAVPEPAPTDVLIRVSAAGVNNTDINTRIGWYSADEASEDDAAWNGRPLHYPRVQGADVCGRIVAVGAEVDPSRIGERVIVEPSLVEAGGKLLDAPWYLGSECDGGFAQYLAVAARHAFQVKSNLTDVELASFPCSYSTAENMLTRAAVTERDTVLVTGASGGVGSAAVQLARARGATVLAVAGASKAAKIAEIGAARVFDRGDDLRAELGENSVDVVVDLVGGPKWPALLDLLRRKGRYAVSGAIAGAEVTLDLRKLYLKDLTFHGCTVLEPEVFGNLVRRIETGEIRPLVAATYPLKDIAKAQEAFTEKAHVGKIVLEVP